MLKQLTDFISDQFNTDHIFTYNSFRTPFNIILKDRPKIKEMHLECDLFLSK
jgi:hypothetical protein